MASSSASAGLVNLTFMPADIWRRPPRLPLQWQIRLCGQLRGLGQQLPYRPQSVHTARAILLRLPATRQPLPPAPVPARIPRGLECLSGVLRPLDQYTTPLSARHLAPPASHAAFYNSPATTRHSFLQIPNIAYESRPQYVRNACATCARSPAGVPSAVIFPHCSDAIVPSLIARPS